MTAALAAGLLGCAVTSAAAQETFRLRIASGHPPVQTYVNLITTFFVPEVTKRVAERTNEVGLMVALGAQRRSRVLPRQFRGPGCPAAPGSARIRVGHAGAVAPPPGTDGPGIQRDGRGRREPAGQPAAWRRAGDRVATLQLLAAAVAA